MLFIPIIFLIFGFLILIVNLHSHIDEYGLLYRHKPPLGLLPRNILITN